MRNKKADIPRGYNFRILNRDDWQLFRDIRLESLRGYGGALASLYAYEARKPPRYWKETLESAFFFGEFTEKMELVGLIGMRPLTQEFLDKHLVQKRQIPHIDEVALYYGAYVRPGYRGNTSMLYQMRDDCAIKQGFKAAAMFIFLPLSRRSMQIHLKNGAEPMFGGKRMEMDWSPSSFTSTRGRPTLSHVDYAHQKNGPTHPLQTPCSRWSWVKKSFPKPRTLQKAGSKRITFPLAL
jgi:hypothetical protein